MSAIRNLFCWYFWRNQEFGARHGFWFRVFGVGLCFCIDKPVYFSERYGHRKIFRLGRLAIHGLTL